MNRHKVVNTCYFGAILAAFVLSLVHNNKVEASTDPKDYFAYLMESEEDAVIKENDHAMDDVRYFCNTIMKHKVRQAETPSAPVW